MEDINTSNNQEALEKFKMQQEEFEKQRVENLKNYKQQSEAYKEEKQKRKDDIINNHPRFLIGLGFSIFIGILASIFLTKSWGIGISILILLTIVGFFCVNKVRNKSYFGYFLIGTSFLLSTTFAIFSNDLEPLNVVLIWATLMAGFMALTYENFERIPKLFFISLIKRIFRSKFMGINIIPAFINKILKKRDIKIIKGARNNAKGILKGLLISIPVLLVLIIMLSKSDEVFKYYLSSINLSFYDFNLSIDTIWNIVIFIFVFSYVFGAYNSFNAKLDQNIKEGSKWGINIFTISTTLIMIIILYLCFTFIQVSHLYGNGTLPNGISYAEYARSGFFDLIYIVVINMLLVGILKNKIDSESKNTRNLLNIFYSIITILTINMSVAAFYKMNIYIEAYGYTTLRVLVSAFIIFLVLTMIYMLMFIWKGTNIFKITMVTGLVIYLGLNFMNIDNFIATKNINNKTITQTDQEYISYLSIDAQDAITKAYKDKTISETTFENWMKWNEFRKISDSHKFYSYNYNLKKFENLD